MPARYLRTLEYQPLGYNAQSAGSGAPAGTADSDLLLGDLLFHSPYTLGPKAQALGMSCQSCHPNGATHGTLFIAGLSDRAGNVDLSSALLSSGADDGVANAVNVPSLRGCRYTAPYGRDGRTGSLAQFIQDVVSVELDGEPLPRRELAALVRYVLDLDFLPNANLDARNRLSERASPAARRGERAFETPRAGFAGASCASCHPGSSFFRDGRSHRIGSGAPPSPTAIDGGYETPTLLGLAETAPYFHDGRFASVRDVVAWFDREFALELPAAELDDLCAYVDAVGAIDRPRDDRPLALRLDQTFAYASLLDAARPRAIWIAAIDGLLAALDGEPPVIAERVRALRARLEVVRAGVNEGKALAPLARGTRELRLELSRLAADWAGTEPHAEVAERRDAAR